MSFVLFQEGRRCAPRTAMRRLMWAIVTLVPLGIIAAFLSIGAVQGWTGEATMTAADRLWLTVLAALIDLGFVLTLVMGAIRVREHFAEEAARSADGAE